jgi:hypothetical protein
VEAVIAESSEYDEHTRRTSLAHKEPLLYYHEGSLTFQNSARIDRPEVDNSVDNRIEMVHQEYNTD